MAAFDRLRFLLQQCLFNYSGSVYLASSSGSLNPYETILINTLRLATLERLTSLRVSFRPLSTLSGAVFAFLYKVGFEPTAYSLKGNRTTIVLLNLPARATPIAPYAFGIQNTTRPIPFLSRSNQSSFTIGVRVSAFAYHHGPFKLHTRPWLQNLGPIHYPFSYQLTSWFCMEVSTTCYFSSTQVPLAGL